jgi:hypothetical protein
MLDLAQRMKISKRVASAAGTLSKPPATAIADRKWDPLQIRD